LGTRSEGGLSMFSSVLWGDYLPYILCPSAPILRLSSEITPPRSMFVDSQFHPFLSSCAALLLFVSRPIEPQKSNFFLRHGIICFRLDIFLPCSFSALRKPSSALKFPREIVVQSLPVTYSALYFQITPTATPGIPDR